jgi:hypothetical protein
MWDKAGDFSDWWEEQHKLSIETLNDFVEEHPDLFGVVVSGTFNTLMDVAEPSADMWRFGAGLGGGEGGAIKDGFRLLGLMEPLGAVGKATGVAGRQIAAEVGYQLKIANNLRLAKLIKDTSVEGLRIVKPKALEDGLCWAVTSTKALVQTGQRLYVEVADFAKEIGHPFDPMEMDSLDTVVSTWTNWMEILRKIGAKIPLEKEVSTVDEVIAMIPKDGSVLTEIRGFNKDGTNFRHAVHFYRDWLNRVKIMNRDGQIVSRLEDLKFEKELLMPVTVEHAAALENVVVKEVAKPGVIENAMLPAYPVGVLAMGVEAIATGFSRHANETIAQVFEIFKQMRQGKPLLGASVHVVGPNETLPDIAKARYGDESKWPVPAQANSGKLGKPGSLISESQRLVIPELPHIRQFSRVGEKPRPQLAFSPGGSPPRAGVDPSSQASPLNGQANRVSGTPAASAGSNAALQPSSGLALPTQPSDTASPGAAGQAASAFNGQEEHGVQPPEITRVDDVPLDVLRRLSANIDHSLDAIEPSASNSPTIQKLRFQLDDIGQVTRASATPEAQALSTDVDAIKEKHRVKLSAAPDGLWLNRKAQEKEQEQESIRRHQDEDVPDRDPGRRHAAQPQKPPDYSRPDQSGKDGAEQAERERHEAEEAVRGQRLERNARDGLQAEAEQRLAYERAQTADDQRRDQAARERIDAIRTELQALDRGKAEQMERDAIKQQVDKSLADKSQADNLRDTEEKEKIAHEENYRTQLDKERTELETQIRSHADAANKARLDDDTKAKEIARLADEARAQLVTTARLYVADSQKQPPVRDGATADNREKPGHGAVAVDPAAKSGQTEVNSQDSLRSDQAAQAKSLEEASARREQVETQQRDEEHRRAQGQADSEADAARRQELQARQAEEDRKWQEEDRRRKDEAEANQRAEDQRRQQAIEAGQREEESRRLEEAEALREEDRRRQQEIEVQQREEDRRRQEEAEALQREEDRRHQEETRRDEERHQREQAEAQERDQRRHDEEEKEKKKKEEEEEEKAKQKLYWEENTTLKWKPSGSGSGSGSDWNKG